MFWATGAEAQKWNPCDPRYYLITPADCTTYGEQAVKNKPSGKPLPAITREFRRFALSRGGQRIISLGGNYPITLQMQSNGLQLIKD